jgi:hypothetical protein
VNYPERYYLEPECAPGYNKTRGVTMRYKMPTTITCERCVLQWWWITANSCNPPGYAQRTPQPAHVAASGGTCNWWQSNLATCGQAYPEEFWNCADIRVMGGVTRTEPNAPPTASPAAPVAAPVATPVVAPAATPTTTAPPTAPPTAPVAPPVAPRPAPVAPPAPRAAPVAPPAPRAAPAPAPAATPRASAPAPVSTVPTASCAALGWQCGGQGWTGPTCCLQGQCQAYIASYSQCRYECPPGWLCNNAAEKSLVTAALEWVHSAGDRAKRLLA